MRPGTDKYFGLMSKATQLVYKKTTHTKVSFGIFFNLYVDYIQVMISYKLAFAQSKLFHEFSMSFLLIYGCQLK